MKKKHPNTQKYTFLFNFSVIDNRYNGNGNSKICLKNLVIGQKLVKH